MDFLIDQLWKLENNTLKNKEGFWKSTENWRFETEGTMVHLVNESNSKFLFVSSDEVLESVNKKQLWEKGSPDNEGYFTLKDVTSKRVLTAMCTNSLEVKGMNSKANLFMTSFDTDI